MGGGTIGDLRERKTPSGRFNVAVSETDSCGRCGQHIRKCGNKAAKSNGINNSNKKQTWIPRNPWVLLPSSAVDARCSAAHRGYDVVNKPLSRFQAESRAGVSFTTH
jgi:hypothetical protein